MSAAWFVLLLVSQLAVQPALAASYSSLQPASQQLPEQAFDLAGGPARQLTAVRRGSFGGFGGSSAPTASYRPSRSTFGGSRLPGSTALPGGFTGYRRSGFRSTPFILPLALGSGLIAGAAISSLNNNPNAYCSGYNSGVQLQCYRAACEDALRNRCPEAAAESNNTLVLTACPDRRYSECYATPTFNDTALTSFECFGVRRPRFGREDLAAVCHQPDATEFDNGAGAFSGAAAASKVGA
jgi:hypothetical protein